MQTIRGRIKKATSTPRGRIIALSLLVLIMAAVIGGVIYWKIYRKQIIRGELEGLVNKKSGGLYQLRYDSLFLDEAGGNLAIHGIGVNYDSVQYSRLNDADIPPTLVKLSIPTLMVMGVQTPRALLNKEIVGKKLTINQPRIDIYYTDAGADSARYIPPEEIYAQILGNLNLIRLDTLEILDGNITTYKLKSNKKAVELTNTSVRLLNLELDKNAEIPKGRILFSKNIVLNVGQVSFPSYNRPYKYQVDQISMNSLDGSGSVENFRVIPLMKEDAFVRSLPFQDDRFDFNIQNIRFVNLDIPRLFDEEIFADSLILGSANMKIYRDLALKRDKKNRVGTYPHQLLARIPLTLDIKKLVVNAGYVEYKERNHITRQSGKVRFHNVSAAFNNVTNDSASISRNNIMTARMNARFLDKTPLKVNWKFYLGNARGRFDVEGSLGSIAAKDVNQLTEPMGPARLEDGRIQSLYFNFDANNYKANGKVKMLYENLKLSLLEKQDGKKELDKKTVASFVANIVVKNDNPTRKDEARVSDVTFERDTNRSIFHLVWKSIFKGVRETVGIKK